MIDFLYTTKQLVLNPEYRMQNDIKRIVLTSDSIFTMIHPLHAMILSFFDQPLYYADAIEKIHNAIPIDKENVDTFLKQLVCNESEVWIGQNETAVQFPKYTLIEKPDNYKKRNYQVRDFFITSNNIDLFSPRFYKPLDAMLMINTSCYTDCVYCYADRTNKNYTPIPLQRLYEIIEEAKILKMRNFDISGGEFFLYKEWDLLLRKMLDAGFKPKSIPTKVPLNEEHIKKIRDVGYEQIQISLDSIQPNILKTTLKVQDDYFKKIESMISLLSKHGVKFRVNSLITSYNCNISNFSDLIDFLKQWPNFVEISIGVVGYTIYKENKINYLNYPKLHKAESVVNYLQNKYCGDPSIVISPIAKLEDMCHYDDDKFFRKARCSGNMYGFVILPDGNITICEELYWHPEFIIGNINKQSIMEVWSSQKANDLFYLQQSLFKKKSACSSCESFSMCRHRGGVCWRKVIKTYGIEHWDFPDPRCKFAPEKINNLYIG